MDTGRKISRREFITGAVAAALVARASFALTPQGDFTEEIKMTAGKHELKPLPYSYKELEPAIDAETMEIHYSKHHQAYVDNLNKAIAGTEMEQMPLMDMFKKMSTLPAAVRNNGGGHYNHTFFWETMTAQGKSGAPSAALMEAITKKFGSIEDMKTQINQAGLTRFGSGWSWLIKTDQGLEITSTPNQDNPLMDVADKKGTPLLGIDVWEHAYYLKYRNKRADYLAAWWSVVNWAEVSKRFGA
jgi:Fe-Mn family superoxide dismutase